MEKKDDTFHKNKLRSTTTSLPVGKWHKRKKIVHPWNRPDNNPNRVWPWFPRSVADEEKERKRRKLNKEIERGRPFFPRYPKENRSEREVKESTGKTKSTLRNEQRVNDSNNKDEKPMSKCSNRKNLPIELTSVFHTKVEGSRRP